MFMKSAVVYAKVSTKECGLSLEAQMKIANIYASTKGLCIVKEFSYFESGQNQSREQFNAMFDYLRTHPEVRIVPVEATNCLFRNLKDHALVESLVEELDLEIHFVKEDLVLSRESRPRDRLVLGMLAQFARSFVQNTQGELLKGQLVKAEKGQYPGRVPYGYTRNRELRTLVADPHRAQVVKLAFDLCAKGQFTLTTLGMALATKTGEKLCNAHLRKILRSHFYVGRFSWRGCEYKGKPRPLIAMTTFKRVQRILNGRRSAKS